MDEWYDDLENELNDAKAKITELEGKINTSEAINTDIQNKLAEKDKEIEGLKDELENCIVLLNSQSAIDRDIGSSPIETLYPLSGIHANVINSILNENFIYQNSFIESLILITIFMILYMIVIYKKKQTIGFVFYTFLILFRAVRYFYQRT